MKRETFARLCLVTALAGLVVMYFAETVIEKDAILPGELGPEDVGDNVKVIGEVSNFYSKGDVSYLDLGGNDSIQIVDFQGRSYAEGENLTVYGTVEMHRGSIQVVPTRIDLR